MVHRTVSGCSEVSGNHRMAEVVRDFWRSPGPTLYLKLGHQEASYIKPHSGNFWISPRREISWNLCPTMSGPQWKSDSWHWQGASCVPVCVQCFVSHHWENSKRSLASCPLYTVDARYLYILRFSEVLFSRVPDLTAFPHMKDAPVPQLSKWPTSCPHQILYEDFMGDSIKNVNEVQVDNNHWSFLIYQANCFIVECYLIHQAWLPLPEGMLTTSYHFLICVPANDFWYSLLHHFPRNEVKVIGLKFYEVSSCSPWRHLLSSND